MWRWTQPTARAKDDCSVAGAVDVIDARKIQDAYKKMNGKHRAVLGWYYVKNTRPGLLCKKLDVSMQTLADLLYAARQEMIDKKA